MSDLAETADVIVVGGGSAGAVLAARLSQDPGRLRPPTSTAPTGGPNDPWSVSSTTNVTVIMLAERIYQRVYAS